jgi:hypothetical protein
MLGGGSGFILDMIVRMRQNSALIRKNRYFDSKGHDIKTHAKVRNTHQKPTAAQLQTLCLKLKKQRTKSNTISIISLLLSLAIVAVLIFYLF